MSERERQKREKGEQWVRESSIVKRHGEMLTLVKLNNAKLGTRTR